MRFSYPVDHPLTPDFEEQMSRLIREYKGDAEYLSVHHPDEPDACDDAPDASALALLGAAGGIGTFQLFDHVTIGLLNGECRNGICHSNARLTRTL